MNIITIEDLTAKQIKELIDSALIMKKLKKLKKSNIDLKQGSTLSTALKGKTLALLFEKQSTRTRVGFEVAMTQLGGHAIYLDYNSTHLKKASLYDEIKCISNCTDAIAARVYEDEKLKLMSEYSSKPVINALSDLHHPTQALADAMSIKEFFGNYDVKVAYVGDGNNVCNSLIQVCAKLGIKLVVAAPKGYEPKVKGSYILLHDPVKAVHGADVVYTDTWVSMGLEEEKNQRVNDFKSFTVTKFLLSKAKRNVKFMHCLPAYRGFEVEEGIIEDKNSIVFPQAENKMHMGKAILLKLMAGIGG